MRGYFSIGIVNGKSEVNIGTLWRSAYQLGASYIFTIGKRYAVQCSDTPKAWRHIPLFNFSTMEDFIENRPYECQIVGIETGSRELGNFCHPERAIYLLGAEDNGLPQQALDKCNALVSIPAVRTESYNVAVAGSIIMYDRLQKVIK